MLEHSLKNYEKITLKNQTKLTATTQPISGEEIRQIREQANLSQAIFACYLNVSTGYVSQLERGTKRAKGPLLVLLHVIKYHGIKILH